MLLLATVLVAATSPSPLAPPPGMDECWVAPLQVNLSEMAMMGRIAEEVTRNHCSRDVQPDFYGRFPGRSFTVARNRFIQFRLFGQTLTAGLDVVVVPGTNLDSMYATPAVDLPESWQRAIDYATYPALAVGAATITTVVLMRLLR